MEKQWKLDELILGVSHLARREVIDRIVPLDDFDLEKASALREHLRVPGMGETTTRYFRDKLAMRVKARERRDAGARRSSTCSTKSASATSARRWRRRGSSSRGSRRAPSASGRSTPTRRAVGRDGRAGRRVVAHFLLESFVAGDVYHVDSIVYEREVRLAVASRYGTPPFDVSHGGGVFSTSLIERGTALERGLLELNRRLLTSLGLVRGVSHSEYILGRDGQFVFLETSARVGGAHIAELVEAATGLNLWAEWARIEVAGGESGIRRRGRRETEYAGLIVSLARQEQPPLRCLYRPGSGVAAEQAPSRRTDRALAVVRTGVEQLVGQYGRRFAEDFVATLPPKATPMD